MPSHTSVLNGMPASEYFEFAALREAYFYPRAIVEEFAPYLQGQVIEVGAGIGQLTGLLAQRAEKILAVEPDASLAKIFREQWPEIPLVEGTVRHLPPETSCNTLVSINVIEHIWDHVEEMSRYRALLAPTNGHLCLFTPARPEIYALMDKDFGHHRRYTKSSLHQALTEAGFRASQLYYFNLPGYFVWLVHFKLLKSRSFNPRLVHLFDRFVFRMAHIWERRIMRPPLGQSLIAIAQA